MTAFSPEVTFPVLVVAYFIGVLLAARTMTKHVKQRSRRLIMAAAIVALLMGLLALGLGETINYRLKLSWARAKFEKRCTAAGEKILKTVPGVHAIYLTGDRLSLQSPSDEADQNWRGAGLPRESTGLDYVASFLLYDNQASVQLMRQLGPSPRETQGSMRPTSTRGYLYVVTKEDGRFYQYSLEAGASSEAKGSRPSRPLHRALFVGELPRYQVDVEDWSTAEDRRYWIAGTRMRISDRETGELLGERLEVSLEPGFGSKVGFRQPWTNAEQCMFPGRESGDSGLIRYFTQKILVPAKRS